MYSSTLDLNALMGEFQIEQTMMRYSIFVPRLYNFCKSLGLEQGKIMPSRAFCSDESQGYPIILITKHFGTFPFNHGRVGGIVATDRHGPHADHGQDMVIIQASHVGYDPDARKFGAYRRIQTDDNRVSPCCGKVDDILNWYLREYRYARDNIRLSRDGSDYLITIDNQLLNDNRDEGLFLNKARLIKVNSVGEYCPLKSYSTARCFRAVDSLRDLLGDTAWPIQGDVSIGDQLAPELFYFKRDVDGDIEDQGHLERNLIKPMPWIVASEAPLLIAAQINTQVEFDRTLRTVLRAKGYQGKRLVYIAGLNIDISPQAGQVFPLTKFVPWAAYIQQQDGSHHTLEQAEIFDKLMSQSTDNLDQIDLEVEIQQMGEAEEVKIAV